MELIHLIGPLVLGWWKGRAEKGRSHWRFRRRGLSLHVIIDVLWSIQAEGVGGEKRGGRRGGERGGEGREEGRGGEGRGGEGREEGREEGRGERRGGEGRGGEGRGGEGRGGRVDHARLHWHTVCPIEQQRCGVVVAYTATIEAVFSTKDEKTSSLNSFSGTLKSTRTHQ